VIPFLEVLPADTLLQASYRLTFVHLTKQPAYWHYHPEIEISLVLSGTGTRQVGDAVGAFKPGDLVVYGSRIPHDFTLRGDNDHAEFLLIQLRPELLASFVEFAPIRQLFEYARFGLLLEYFDSPNLQALLKYKELSPAQQLLAVLALLDELTQAQRQDQLQILSSVEFSSEGTNTMVHDRINVVLQHIQDHYHHSIDLEQISAATFMTVPSFCRWFKKSLNISFLEYLNKYRIEEVCRQLVTSDKTITLIAQGCGFESLSGFNRCFHKYKHMAPRTYRNQARPSDWFKRDGGEGNIKVIPA